MHIARTLAAGAVVWSFVHCAPAHAQVNIGVVVGVAPPVAIVEPPPPPRVGFVWAPGFWQWDGRTYGWQAGHWEAEQEGESYIASQWVEAPGGWRFVPAHWRRSGHFKHHDDDGDAAHFCPPGQAKKGRCEDIRH